MTVNHQSFSENYRNRAEEVGLDPKFLFRKFRLKNQAYRILGLKQYVRKYPVVVVREEDGKLFSLTIEQTINICSKA